MLVEQNGDVIVIRDGRGAEIVLTAEETAQLAMQARRFARELALSGHKGGFSATPSLRVKGVRIVHDALLSSVLLGVLREDGEEEAYLLPLETAEGLHQDLAEAIEKIRPSVRPFN